MASFNLLNIGTQALNTNNTALATTSQNIANANTDGYTRQRSEIMSVNGLGGSYVQSISRTTDQFLTKQMWSDVSTYKSLNIQDNLMSQTDNLLASSSTSLSTALDNYFVSMQNAVDDPTSLANRELYIEQTNALSRRFNDLSAQLDVQNDSVNETLKSSTALLNEYSQSIADINKQINYLTARDEPTNELKDQRDLLINKISELVDVQVVEQGADFNMFIGNGQPLVVGDSVNRIEYRQGDPDPTQPQLFVYSGASELEISDKLQGGTIGGVLEFRENTLNETLNEIGRIALIMADETNKQHSKGMDLNNELGGNVFNDINSEAQMQSRISAHSGNASAVSVARVQIEDTSKLTTDDYEVVVSGENELIVKRQDTGRVVNLSKVASSADPMADDSYFIDQVSGEIRIKMDGLDITVDTAGVIGKGDSFLVQPTRSAAADLQGVLTDGDQVALASPVRITTNTNNQGTGVATVEVTNPKGTAFGDIGNSDKLDPPIEIVFNNADPIQYTAFDISNPSDPQPITGMQNIAYTPGQAIAFEGYEVTIKEQPKAGDRFSFDFNKDGFSDNRNALALSAIQSKDVIGSGSLQDQYSRIIEDVGSRTASLKINLTASETVMKTTQEALASVRGVNLDEEAARLVQYQQAYQASARVISTSQTLFDTLLQAF